MPPPPLGVKFQTFFNLLSFMFYPIFKLKWPKSEEKKLGLVGFGPGLGAPPLRKSWVRPCPGTLLHLLLKLKYSVGEGNFIW